MLQYLDKPHEILVFENAGIRRVITFRFGRPVASAVTRLADGTDVYTWKNDTECSVLDLPGFDWSMVETTYEDGIVTFTSNYIVRWVFTVAENTPAIRSQLFARALPVEETGIQTDLGEDSTDTEITADITDRVFHDGRHVSLRTVAYADRTDHVDALASVSHRGGL